MDLDREIECVRHGGTDFRTAAGRRYQVASATDLRWCFNHEGREEHQACRAEARQREGGGMENHFLRAFL